MRKTVLVLAVAGLALAETRRPMQFYLQNQPPHQRLKKDRFKCRSKGKR